MRLTQEEAEDLRDAIICAEEDAHHCNACGSFVPVGDGDHQPDCIIHKLVAYPDYSGD